jgi:hypothetical protein
MKLSKLTKSQRAVVAATLMKTGAYTREEAAKKMGVRLNYVALASKFFNRGRVDLLDALMSGEMTVSEANKKHM